MAYIRIRMTRDYRSANGELIAEAGATGTIRSRDEGFVGVLFDGDQEAYVKPGYNGRLFQQVPFIYTTTPIQ